MIVDFTPAARNDLAAIGDWIARENPTRAATFVDELIDQAESLAEWPDRFPEVDPSRRPGLRRLNHRGYRIFYTVEAGHVSILSVQHGRRGKLDQ